MCIRPYFLRLASPHNQIYIYSYACLQRRKGGVEEQRVFMARFEQRR